MFKHSRKRDTMQPTRKARIGMVSYINIGPIYEVWKDSVHRDDWEVIEAPPSRLNIMLAAGQLDLGFVSSYEYCQRPDQYRILSDLSISATGQVGSVFLFSQRPLEELDGQQVLLTNQSDTSVALSKIILEEFYKVRPIYCMMRHSSSSTPKHLPIVTTSVKSGKSIRDFRLSSRFLPFVKISVENILRCCTLFIQS